MHVGKEVWIVRENNLLKSSHLDRNVKVDFYLPANIAEPSSLKLLLINDGQDLEKMNFESILNGLVDNDEIAPIIAVGIHAGHDRKMEYGTAGKPDFKGRGAKAVQYSKFILEELIPFIQTTYNLPLLEEKAFAGFSLGGLSALDICWNHSEVFSYVAVFSGSLWWRVRDQDHEDYNDEHDRIMHQIIRLSPSLPKLKFFFECGQLDEVRDRNNNGVIDSIDDTLDLISVLKEKGYSDDDIYFLLMEDGRHDVETWGRALPYFLKWAFAKK